MPNETFRLSLTPNSHTIQTPGTITNDEIPKYPRKSEARNPNPTGFQDFALFIGDSGFKFRHSLGIWVFGYFVICRNATFREKSGIALRQRLTTMRPPVGLSL